MKLWTVNSPALSDGCSVSYHRNVSSGLVASTQLEPSELQSWYQPVTFAGASRYADGLSWMSVISEFTSKMSKVAFGHLPLTNISNGTP